MKLSARNVMTGTVAGIEPGIAAGAVAVIKASGVMVGKP